MTRAATATLPLEGLPDIPCGAEQRTAPASGPIYVTRCTLPAGHLTREVPHRWGGWQPTGDVVEPDPLDVYGDIF